MFLSKKKESVVSIIMNILEQQKQKVRALLKNRIVGDAFKMATEEGINVSKTQVKNQSKNVSDVKKGKSGAKMEVTMELLENMKSSITKDTQFEISSENNDIHFRIIRSFPESIKLYLASSPDNQKLKTWRQHVQSLLEENVDMKKAKVTRILKENPGGIIFPSRLFVDTTFNVAGCYVTLVLGEIAKFRVHTNNGTENHLHFAEKLEELFKSIGKEFNNPVCPCVVLDGETSLLHYPEKLNASPIRCDFYLLPLLSHKFGSKATENAKNIIIGRMANSCWKRGILGSFDNLEFERKLTAAEKNIDQRIMNWLKNNKIMLMKCCSITAKLMSRHVLHYFTTNISESYNGLLKSYVSNRKRVDGVIDGLTDFVTHSYKEVWAATMGYGETVVFVDFPMVSREHYKEKIRIIRESGLSASFFLASDPPQDILYKNDVNILAKEERKSRFIKVIQVAKNSALLEDQQKKKTAPLEQFSSKELEKVSCAKIALQEQI